jgi:hypothetical protein
MALACSYGNVGHVVSMDRLSARISSVWPRDTALRGAMNAAAGKLSFTSVSLGLSVAPHPVGADVDSTRMAAAGKWVQDLGP